MSKKSKIAKNISRVILGAFFVFAGIIHFVNPQFYLPLIPDWIPFPEAVNLISGLLEVLFGLLVLYPKTKKWGSLGIVVLLILFIPTHVYFIQVGSCIPEVLCVDPWMGWVRLVVVHPLLLWWAWSAGRD